MPKEKNFEMVDECKISQIFVKTKNTIQVEKKKMWMYIKRANVKEFSLTNYSYDHSNKIKTKRKKNIVKIVKICLTTALQERIAFYRG